MEQPELAVKRPAQDPDDAGNWKKKDTRNADETPEEYGQDVRHGGNVASSERARTRASAFGAAFRNTDRSLSPAES